jgi:hypothetical protein
MRIDMQWHADAARPATTDLPDTIGAGCDCAECGADDATPWTLVFPDGHTEPSTHLDYADAVGAASSGGWFVVAVSGRAVLLGRHA